MVPRLAACCAQSKLYPANPGRAPIQTLPWTAHRLRARATLRACCRMWCNRLCSLKDGMGAKQRNECTIMEIQFNTDSSVMGTENVAERIEAQLRDRLGRFEERLTRLEIHVSDSNARKGGGDDKRCTIEARPRGGDPVTVTAEAGDVDSAARQASAKMVALLDSHFGKADRHAR